MKRGFWRVAAAAGKSNSVLTNLSQTERGAVASQGANGGYFGGKEG